MRAVLVALIMLALVSVAIQVVAEEQLAGGCLYLEPGLTAEEYMATINDFLGPDNNQFLCLELGYGIYDFKNQSIPVRELEIRGKGVSTYVKHLCMGAGQYFIYMEKIWIMSSLLRGHYTNDRVSFDHCIIEWTGLSANCLGEVKLINCAFMSNRIEQSILAGNCSGRVFLENNILIGPAPLILSDYSASRHPELYHIQNNIFMERDVQIPIPLNNREVKLDLGDLRTSAYHIAPNGPASEERYGVWEEPIPLSSILPPEIPEDINGDGTFSPGDAMCLLQKYLGKPCSE